MRRLPPATVWVYVLKWAVILLVAMLVAFDAWVAVAVVLMAPALGALWRGSRAAWVLLLVLEGSVLVSAPFTDTPWWAVPLTIVALGLLAAPPTRDHVVQRVRET